MGLPYEVYHFHHNVIKKITYTGRTVDITF